MGGIRSGLGPRSCWAIAALPRGGGLTLAAAPPAAEALGAAGSAAEPGAEAAPAEGGSESGVPAGAGRGSGIAFNPGTPGAGIGAVAGNGAAACSALEGASRDSWTGGRAGSDDDETAGPSPCKGSGAEGVASDAADAADSAGSAAIVPAASVPAVAGAPAGSAFGAEPGRDVPLARSVALSRGGFADADESGVAEAGPATAAAGVPALARPDAASCGPGAALALAWPSDGWYLPDQCGLLALGKVDCTSAVLPVPRLIV